MSSKVATYLNEHLVGEATTVLSERQNNSEDASFLTIKPELVVYPRVTNDIRKAARFAWQLAEKGHVLAITPRGGGGDDTGAAIGSGMCIDTTKYMNTIFEYDAKQKLVRVQPGASVSSVQNALQLQGAQVSELSQYNSTDTVGGAIGYGALSEALSEVEVVLASGEVLQTKQLTKRELNKKKGLAGFEGDIYRKIDALIEDNKELIKNELDNENDVSGYARIRDVKTKQGFNLAPLIVGSQGTLGIVSEMILKAEYVGANKAVGVAVFTDEAQACVALEATTKLDPSVCRLIDAAYFEYAAQLGKKFSWYDDVAGSSKVAGVLYVEFQEFSARAANKKAKKFAKLSRSFGGAGIYESNDEAAMAALKVCKDIVETYVDIPPTGATAVSVIDGAYIPRRRYNDFVEAVRELGVKRHINLPLSYDANRESVSVRPQLYLQKVADKQKIFKLLDEYAAIVASHDGFLIGATTNDGRSKTIVTHKMYSKELQELYKAIKETFDAHGILNPGVKQAVDIQSLVRRLKS